MFARSLRLLSYSPPRLSTLPNGVRVVTFNELSPVSAVSIFTKMGARYEDPEFAGCTRALEKMAYGVRGEGNESFYNNSGQIGVTNHRELLINRTACLRWEVDAAMDLLIEMTLQRNMDDASLAAAKELSAANVEMMRKEPSKLLFELLHQAAWKNNTLGRPAVDLDDDLAAVTLPKLDRFLRTFARPERMTVVALGVEHDAMIEITEKKLSPVLAQREYLPVPESVDAPAVYTGGVRTIENLVAPSSLQKFYEKNNTHMGLMYQGTPLDDKNYFVKTVIQSMLGGGMSFSIGGPGKGIMSKLYRECLCRYGWLEGVEAITAAYSDSGLVGIYGQAPHEYNIEMLNLLMSQMQKIPERISETIVQMAKNQFRSQNLMAAEERTQSLEEVGRWAALYGRTWTPEEIEAEVEAVNLDRIREFISPQVQGPPTFAVYGNVQGLDLASIAQPRASKL